MTALLIAATGGHLTQLDRLAPRIPGVDEDSVWVTFDTPQSRSLLRDRNRVFVPYSGPRDFVTAMRNSWQAARIIRRVKPKLLVSTGSAIAVSFLPMGRVFGLPSVYIESAARADGPSLTGSILRRVPGVQLFSQYRSWAKPPWSYAGSIFDAYKPDTYGDVLVTPRRVLVTLGTMPFDFRRLLERVVQVVPPECEVTWQTGNTLAHGLNISSRSYMTSTDLGQEVRSSDVVIAHAGIGSAIGALDAGKCPILIPRKKAYGEHVDDHQHQIARELDSRRLALHRTVTCLTADDLALAASRPIKRFPVDAPLWSDEGHRR